MADRRRESVGGSPTSWDHENSKADFEISWYRGGHDPSHRRSAAGGRVARARPGGRDPRRPPGGEVDPRPPVDREGVRPRDGVRLGAVGRPGRARRSAPDTGIAARTRHHRRGPAPAGPVPDAARACGSAAAPGALPGSRQRVTGVASPVVGVARRPDRLSRAGRALAGGSGRAQSGSTVASRRVPAVVSGPLRGAQRRMAGKLHPHVPRARCSRAGDPHPIRDPAAILVDAGPLARPGLERLRIRAFLRSLGPHRTALPRHPDPDLRGAPAAAVA